MESLGNVTCHPGQKRYNFIIAQRLARGPPVYHPRERGNLIQGTFYEPESKKVMEFLARPLFRIERILKFRGKGAIKQRSAGPVKGFPVWYLRDWQFGIAKSIIQDNNFCVTLRSNDSRHLFLTNFKSSYCVALPRQMCLKDGKNWEVGYHDTLYLLTWLTFPAAVSTSEAFQ